MVRAHLLISGLVQGVCFRAETLRRAQALNLSGWVKNSFDRKVEAVFEGPRPSVEEMIVWCKTGPAGAVVRDVEVEWEEGLGEKGFYIR